MSYAVRKPSGDAPRVTRQPALAKLSQQAERAVPGKSSAEAEAGAGAGAIIHPRAAPPVVHTPPWPG
jgi:hypothetical protein